jgi:hypothetical protein
VYVCAYMCVIFKIGSYELFALAGFVP